MACPECRSSNLRKFGTKWYGGNGSGRVLKQQYICKDCGRITVNPSIAPTRDAKGRFVKSDSCDIPKQAEAIPSAS
jgi:transposase-like protein